MLRIGLHLHQQDALQMQEIAVAAAKLVGVLLFVTVFGTINFLPAIVARKRDSVSFGAISVLNLLGGATGVFWCSRIAE
jgi:hypothetical protein